MSETLQTIGIVMPLGSQQGGAEALLRHLLQHGSRRFKLVCVYFQDGPLVEEGRLLGYESVVLSATRLSSPLNFIRTVLALRQWVKARKVDVLFSWMPKAHLYGAFAAFGLKTKVIWYQHGVPEGGPLDRIATRLQADAVFCCSKTSQAYQDRMVPKRKTFVAYPGISFKGDGATSKTEARRLLGLPDEIPIVLMVARLERWKGVHVFIAAAKRILHSLPDANLVVVGGVHPGDAGYAKELGGLVEGLEHPKQFLLAGQRSMEEVKIWQSAADLIVHPVTGVEAFGMAVPEAMACGKVVIASDEGGPSEVIEDGLSGILVRKNEPDMLADAVIDLMADPTRREQMGAAAKKRAAAFSVEVFTMRLDELLANVISGVGGR